MAFLPCQLHGTVSFSRAGLNHTTVSWSRSRFVRSSGSGLLMMKRNLFVLQAADFQHLFEEGPTEKVYTSTPLAGLGQAQQGKFCEEWARKVLQAGEESSD